MRTTSFEAWKKQMADRAKKTKTPILALCELTPRCNLDCKMCFVHNTDSNKLKDRELSTETWKRIFDEAYDMGLMFATLTGGECLLRSDFKELYLHLWNKHVYVTVMTNGTLLNEEYVEFFKAHKPELVQISLYGSCEEGYLNVTGHYGFEKVIKNVRSLMDAGIPVKIAITPSAYMKDDYINIIRFCKENKFKFASGEFFLLENRYDADKDDYYLSPEEIFKLSTERACLSGSLEPLSSTPEPCGSCTEAPKGLTCSAGSCTAVVSWDGKMYPCNCIPMDHASLLEISYAQAWEKTKQAVSEMLLGMECVGCAYDKTCPKCPAVRLNGLYTGHCNPAVCEMTRRLVAAGVKKLEQPEKNCD